MDLANGVFSMEFGIDGKLLVISDSQIISNDGMNPEEIDGLMGIYTEALSELDRAGVSMIQEIHSTISVKEMTFSAKSKLNDSITFRTTDILSTNDINPMAVEDALNLVRVMNTNPLNKGEFDYNNGKTELAVVKSNSVEFGKIAKMLTDMID